MVVSGVAGLFRLAGYWTLVVVLFVILLPSQAHAAGDGFVDVPEDHVFAEEIAWLASTGITQGRGDGTFGVSNPVTRGAMAAFLYRFDGEPDESIVATEFDDVPAGHVFETEIGWLASTGITQGRGDGTFGVNDPVTRGAMAAFLYRFDGEPEGPFDGPTFLEVPEGHVFETEIGWLASTGITQGRGDGTFGLNDPVTRGAMAAFLYRFDLYQRGEPLPAPELPEPPATFAADRWERIPNDGQVFGSPDTASLPRMHAVTVGGPGLVAVGDVNLSAAVWTSSDGTSWQRVPHDPQVFGDDGFQSMQAVTVGGPGLVAVGRDDFRAGIWVSEDGASWSRVQGLSDTTARLTDITAGGPGLVAVGSSGGQTTVLTSVDGLTWEHVEPEGDPFPERTGIASITAGGPGLVAVGADGARDAAAVWTSIDGRSWQRVRHDEATFGGERRMWSVTATKGQGVVAVGTTRGGSAVVWTSKDGRSWQRIPHDPAVFGKTGVSPNSGTFVEMRDVTRGGPGLVAVGQEADFAGQYGTSVVWTSEDGDTWHRVAHDVDAFGEYWEVKQMNAVTAGGPGLVAVGRELSEAIVWTSSPDAEE